MAARFSSTSSRRCRWRAQERLLRAIEYGEVTRIGSSRPIRVDVRIVAATNEHLPALVDEGRFRADLLDRLSLRGDHPAAAAGPRGRHRSARRLFRPANGDGARLGGLAGLRPPCDWRRWTGHDWPGNVRELQERVERAVYRWADPEKPVDALSFDPFASPWQPVTRPAAAKIDATASPRIAETPSSAAPPMGAVSDLRAAVDGYERQILSDTMARCRFNQKVAAEALGLSYDQIRHALKKHGLNQ